MSNMPGHCTDEARRGHTTRETTRAARPRPPVFAGEHLRPRSRTTTIDAMSDLSHPGRVCAVLLALAGACGPGSDAGGSSTAATASTSAADDTSAPTSSSTGDPLCALAVGVAEPMQDDPAGCYTTTDEAACEAKRELGECVILRGQRTGCNGAGLCMEEIPEFLGCRPFELCKPYHALVCRTRPDGEIEAFYTQGCTPAGFSLCQPQPAEFESGHPLRSCL